MNRVVRIFIIFLGCTFAIPTILFATYDVLAFQSRQSEITKIFEAASPDERNPPPLLQKLLEASLGGRTAAYAAKLLTLRLSIPKVPGGQHAKSLLWWALVALHFDERQQITLIASLNYMGNNRFGMSTESLARFNRPMSALSRDELATLVAITHSPSWYASSPELLNKRKEFLLTQIQGIN
jgi:hypothetical protein